jgi:hypothetical protein
MLPKSTSGLVGLIVIESFASSGELAAADIANTDATLSQTFNWLSRGNRVESGERKTAPRWLGADAADAIRRFSVRRFASRLFGRGRPALVAAECRDLGVQLERAARQLRRKIDAARSSPR